jgi:EmrB/QacA subfamily drug resistance transporter
VRSMSPETAPDSAARWVLVSSILASSMAFIDGTALSVVMPSVQADLRATGPDLVWVSNGFSLPLAALLLLGGVLGDSFGRKRLFLAGIVVFAAASVACGWAPDVSLLIAARVVQGVGGALMIPGSLAMLSLFFGPAQRGKAIGTWSAFSVLASALGPVLGGFLAHAGHWRWVFFINLPLAGIALAVLLLKTPPDEKPDSLRRVDWWGALALVIGLAALNHGLIRWPMDGLADRVVAGALLAGVALLGVFGVIQRRAPQPLLPLDVFKSRSLVAASLVSLLFYTAFHGMLFFLPLNLIQVQGYDPAEAGLTQLPLMVLLIGLSRWAGQLVDRRGPRLPLTVGPAVAGLGFLLFALPGITEGPGEFWFRFLPGLLLAGVGLGLTAAPLSTTVMGSVSSEKLGLASGINSTLSRLTAVLAVTVMGAVMLARFDSSLTARVADLQLPAEAMAQLGNESAKLAEAQPPFGLDEATSGSVRQAIRAAFVDGFRVIALLAAALSGLAALVAVLLLEKRHALGAGEP